MAINDSKPAQHSPDMIDVYDANFVEVEISEDGQRFWVNIDGVCRLRVQKIMGAAFLDRRPKPESWNDYATRNYVSR